PMYLTTQVIMWNSDRVSAPDQQDIRQHGLDALLNPKWKGQIAVTTAEAGGGQLGGYYQIIQDPKYGWAYLEKLAAQNTKVYQSSITLAADMVAGEFALGVGGSDTVAWPQISKGAPLGFAYYGDTISSEQAMFISSHAPHPSAARLFMEWGTSLPAQEQMAEISGGLISHSDWHDTRTITKKDWYTAPKKLDYAWASDPQFNKDADSIVRRWVSLFKKS
ncbi:MAG: extracellular solute-binding protein, partial [Chloroflexota bacterium]|nr:extracellular solute-binding protein [Chloroflexota bacterium]